MIDVALVHERVIRVELDKGFHEGKQYGRGSAGGQVRDELRADYDEGRGGYGAAAFAPQPTHFGGAQRRSRGASGAR